MRDKETISWSSYSLILCYRFNDKNFQSQLSAWLKPHVQAYSNFGLSLKSLIQFFKHITIEAIIYYISLDVLSFFIRLLISNKFHQNNRDSRIHISKSNLPVEIHKSNTFDNESLPSSSSRSNLLLMSKMSLRTLKDAVNCWLLCYIGLPNQKLNWRTVLTSPAS